MKHIVQELALLAARLPPSDRLQLVEAILATLDKPARFFADFGK